MEHPLSPQGEVDAPNPNAPAFRPSPHRAATLASSAYPHNSSRNRATSQPAGEKLPPPPASTPGSGRGSPGMNGGDFGVIGGTRTPGRFGNALGGIGGGIATRASSFSAGELREPRNASLTRTLSSHIEEHPSRSRSASPYPTFSPNSTPPTSPRPEHHNGHVSHSPPKAAANVSRSRSQSLAAGARPMAAGAGGFIMPMSTLETPGAFRGFPEKHWGISPPLEASNMSPFSRAFQPVLDGTTKEEFPSRNGVSQPPLQRFRSPQDAFFHRSAQWPTSVPGSTPSVNSALSSSVASALGGGYNQTPHMSVIGGFDEPANNGNRSGTSSRRHSVSVVGGPGGRRNFGFGDPGQGMSALPRGFSDEDLLPERLGNALNLEIDQSLKREQDKSYYNASNAARGRGPPDFPAFNAPSKGRDGSGESKASRFSFESSFGGGAGGGLAGSPERPTGQGPGPGPIGAPYVSSGGGFPAYQPYNVRPYPQGPPSPVSMTSFARPPSGLCGYYNGNGGGVVRPIPPPQY
ncbi:hypothetical protein P7C73_g582, partial [Tremellales sp. Uapishka_1]